MRWQTEVPVHGVGFYCGLEIMLMVVHNHTLLLYNVGKERRGNRQVYSKEQKRDVEKEGGKVKFRRNVYVRGVYERERESE